MDRERTFIVDDGTEIRQKILDAQSIDPSFVVRLNHIMEAKEPDDVLQRTAVCAGEVCHSESVTISFKEEGRFLTETVWYKGFIFEMHSKRVVPEVSISTIIAESSRSVVWSANGGIRNTGWLKKVLFLGSPLLVENGEPQGTMVIGYNEIPKETGSIVLYMELIALSFSAAYQRALAHEESFEAGQALERERMAQRLHDSVVQGLFTIGLKLKTLVQRDDATREVREVLGECLELLSSLQGDVKDLMHGCERRHPSYESSELLFEELIRDHEEAGGPPATLVTDVPEGISSLQVQVIEVFVREALLNVRKHARARMVVVSIAEQHGEALVSVLDDGVGMRGSEGGDNKNGLHFGLESLDRMARRLHGSMTVDAADEDVGCAVRLRLPLNHMC